MEKTALVVDNLQCKYTESNKVTTTTTRCISDATSSSTDAVIKLVKLSTVAELSPLHYLTKHSG